MLNLVLQCSYKGPERPQTLVLERVLESILQGHRGVTVQVPSTELWELLGVPEG